ncbi:hypothetical protein M9H77_22572 [Catharanthus roseus]|uniref:Uncharacterized protein n=1 Tax=Catharanthus roseus TaxID=4058 RepID=A0ACC0AQV3_CATRO|nr:hypothetical protein M9H77_22572 [Catharanthus roseus]
MKSPSISTQKLILLCLPPETATGKMMQSHLQLSWPIDNYGYCGFDTGLYGFADQNDFSSSFTPEDCSEISFDSYFASTIDPDSLVEFPCFYGEKQAMETMTQSIMEDLEPISSCRLEDTCRWMNESDSDDHLSSQLTSETDLWSPCPVLEQSETPASNMTLNLPGNNSMELDIQLVLQHLLRAYCEAKENGHEELADVLVKRINEKINPLGNSIERVAFNLFQTTTENQGGYLSQQSIKNFEAAFKAFYQWYPHGRFAHFTANSVILEAIPNDAEIVQIVDFDMGEGIQWAPMIEAISMTGKVLKLTSIKSEDESTSTEWRFEETRRRLCDHARCFGLNLHVEETTIENLSAEIKRMKMAGEFREWVAFNCMVGLPHMGRRQSRSRIMDFLRIAKELSANHGSRRGIIAFGDGEPEAGESYTSFFSGKLLHYQALFESVECNFPSYLSEARIAMESLFLSPYVSSQSWFQQWKETSEGGKETIVGFDGWRMSKESLIEAQEMVNEKESCYKVKIEGKGENKMVLEWKDIPLVRVSIWVYEADNPTTQQTVNLARKEQ